MNGPTGVSRIQVAGHGFTVVERGPRDGLPVVFVHGFPFSHRMWTPQLEALSGEFRCVAYDIRGLGTSEVGDGQYTMELFVDDLFGVMDALGIQRAVVCGLSMGGYIALRGIEREPDRYLALVLADTRSEADTDEGRIKRAEAIRTVKERGLHAYAYDFLELVFAPETFERDPEAVGRIRRIIESSEPEGVCGAQLAMASRTDTTDSLREIQVPTLVLVGEVDRLTPPEAAEEMARRIPIAEMRTIPGAAHMSNLENPRAFNEALLGFLRSVRETVET